MVEISEEYDELFEKAIEKWGIEAQFSMAEEEAIEFLLASKHLPRGKTSQEHVAEEIADVFIMCQQLSLFLGEEMVEEKLEEKLDRLEERIEEE